MDSTIVVISLGEKGEIVNHFFVLELKFKKSSVLNFIKNRNEQILDSFNIIIDNFSSVKRLVVQCGMY
jgi:hypothetical protein